MGGEVCGIADGRALQAEKFCTWDDKVTGVNPFLPDKLILHRNVVVRVLRVAFGTLLFAVRLPFILVVALLLALFDAAHTVVRPRALPAPPRAFSRARCAQPPLAIVSRPWRRLFVAPLARLLLALFGFWRVDQSYANPRKLRLPCVLRPPRARARCAACSRRFRPPQRARAGRPRGPSAHLQVHQRG